MPHSNRINCNSYKNALLRYKLIVKINSSSNRPSTELVWNSLAVCKPSSAMRYNTTGSTSNTTCSSLGKQPNIEFIFDTYKLCGVIIRFTIEFHTDYHL